MPLVTLYHELVTARVSDDLRASPLLCCLSCRPCHGHPLQDFIFVFFFYLAEWMNWKSWSTNLWHWRWDDQREIRTPVFSIIDHRCRVIPVVDYSWPIMMSLYYGMVADDAILRLCVSEDIFCQYKRMDYEWMVDKPRVMSAVQCIMFNLDFCDAIWS